MKLVYVLGFLSVVAAGSHKKPINEEDYYKRNKHKKTLIEGRTEEFIHDMPFMATLIRKGPDSPPSLDLLVCTAIIIQPFWTLMPSTCLDTKNTSLLKDGTYVIRSNTPFFDRSSDIYRDRIIEDWYIKHLFDDSDSNITFRLFPMGATLGLVKVRTEFNGKYEVPINIVPRNYQYKVGSSAIEAGWSGWDSTARYRESARLRVIDTRLTDYENCRRFYRYFPSEDHIVTHDMVCTYNAHGKGPCIGGSGGSLIQDGKLIGILGYYKSCKRREWPHVYTKIANFVGWIEETIFNVTKVRQNRYRTQKIIG